MTTYSAGLEPRTARARNRQGSEPLRSPNFALRTSLSGLREQQLTPEEVCKVLADHGQLLGDWLMDQGFENGYYMPELTDGGLLADWLGY